MNRWCAVPTLWALAGCGPRVEAFDQTCRVDEDCVKVTEALPCTCPTAHAIHVDEEKRWNTARNAVVRACLSIEMIACRDNNLIPVCDDNTCTLDVDPQLVVQDTDL